MTIDRFKRQKGNIVDTSTGKHISDKRQWKLIDRMLPPETDSKPGFPNGKEAALKAAAIDGLEVRVLPLAISDIHSENDQKTLCDSCGWVTGSTNHETGESEKPQKCMGRSPILYCEEYVPRIETD